jgi:uncharacterized membrane protein SirB2
MLEFYPQIRYVHILAVTLSGCLFALRGLGILLGQRWPRRAVVRYASYTIDTVLLTAALMLVTILPAALFGNGWLTLKLVLVVVYVVLGVYALRRGETRKAKAVAYVLALSTFFVIVGIARMHHPAGWLLPYLH